LFIIEGVTELSEVELLGVNGGTCTSSYNPNNTPPSSPSTTSPGGCSPGTCSTGSCSPGACTPGTCPGPATVPGKCNALDGPGTDGTPFDDMGFYNWELNNFNFRYNLQFASRFNQGVFDIDWSSPEEGRQRTQSLYFKLGQSGLTTNILKLGLQSGGSMQRSIDGMTITTTRQYNSFSYQITEGQMTTTYYDFDGDDSVDGIK